MSKGFWDDVEVISVYSREQAVEDGVLVDVSKMGAEAGLGTDVKVTAVLFNAITPPKGSIQDVNGRLWDVLYLGRLSLGRAVDRHMQFTVKIGNRNHRLWIIRNAEGVTVGYPGDF